MVTIASPARVVRNSTWNRRLLRSSLACQAALRRGIRSLMRSLAMGKSSIKIALCFSPGANIA
ncbi:hypothetical protein D3C81_1716420 [compost metagenome]